MTDTEIDRTMRNKWKRDDYHRHKAKRQQYHHEYLRRWRANKKLGGLKESA
jgi:hypothetical protein